MMKFSKFFEFAYLAAAAFFLYEAIMIWDGDRGVFEQPSEVYLFLLFVVVGIFMFFFRRHFRHKYANRKK